METTTIETYLTMKEAAAALRCSTSLLRKLISSGRLRGNRLGDVGVRISRSAIAEYLESNPITGPSDLRHPLRGGKRPALGRPAGRGKN